MYFLLEIGAGAANLEGPFIYDQTSSTIAKALIMTKSGKIG